MSRRSRSVLTALLASVLLVAGSMSTVLARSPNAHPKDTPTPGPTAGPTFAPSSAAALVATAAPSEHVPPGQAKKQSATPGAASQPTVTPAPKDNNGQAKGHEKDADPSAATDPATDPTADPETDRSASDPSGRAATGGPTQQLGCGNGKPAASVPTVTPAPTAQPTATPTPEPTATPTEAPTPTPTPTAEPTPAGEPTPVVIPGLRAGAPAVSGGSAAPAVSGGSAPSLLETLADSVYVKVAGAWLQRFNDRAIRDFCNVNALRNTLRAEIDSRLKNLAALEKLIARAGLSADDQATIHATFAVVAVDLRSLQARVAADATLAALEADRSALASMDKLLVTAARWAKAVGAAEAEVGKAAALRDRELTMLALMTSLPPDRAAVVAPLLGQLGEFLDAGRAAARSALASLLAVPATDLESGAAASVLTQAEATIATADAALRQGGAIADQVEPLIGR